MESFNALIEKSIVNNWDRDALTDFKGATLQYHDVARKIEKLHPIRDNFQSHGKEDSPKEDIPAESSNTESADIPDEEPAPLTPEAPPEESPVVEEEPPKPVIQQKPPTLAKRIRDRLKKIAEDLDIITEDE